MVRLGKIGVQTPSQSQVLQRTDFVLSGPTQQHLVSNGPGLYALVSEFKMPTRNNFGVDDVNGISLIKKLSWLEQLALNHCNTIHAELAVIKNFGSKPRSYFVVHNKTSWLSKFKQKMNIRKSKTFDSILDEGNYKD